MHGQPHIKDCPVIHVYVRYKTQSVGRRLLTADALVRPQTGRCEICVGQCGAGTDFCPDTSAVSNVTPVLHNYSFITDDK